MKKEGCARWYALSPNKSLQRAGTHKLLGRGRLVFSGTHPPGARVLTSQAAAAELNC
jgi:hypothetical protein